MLKLALTFLALIVLAAVSFALSYAHLGALIPAFPALNLVVALAIALMKAVLVVFIFMELAHARATSVIAFSTALAFVTLLVGMTIAEKLTRASPPLAPPRSAPAAPPALSPSSST